MQVSAELVKAFTTESELGNPAGVVHDANSLNDEQMLSIASELGFSESAFVQHSDKADFKVRFFAATQEVAFCGHATVATFFSLVEHSVIKVGESAVTSVTQETKAGVFPVDCHQDGKIMMTQSDPVFGEVVEDKQAVAELLGVKAEDLGKLPMQVVSTASPKLIVQMASLAALQKVQPNLEGISEYAPQHGAQGFYIFANDTPSGTGDFAARFFNPEIGINEDPATGVAAGALGCYADRYIFNGGKKQMVIEQGFDMGMSSTIYVDLSLAVKVGGYATSFGQQELEA